MGKQAGVHFCTPASPWGLWPLSRVRGRPFSAFCLQRVFIAILSVQRWALVQQMVPEMCPCVTFSVTFPAKSEGIGRVGSQAAFSYFFMISGTARPSIRCSLRSRNTVWHFRHHLQNLLFFIAFLEAFWRYLASNSRHELLLQRDPER